MGRIAYKQYFSFTFVRNPFAKMVSMYCNRTQNLHDHVINKMTFREFIKNVHESGHDNRGARNQLDWFATPIWTWDLERKKYIDKPDIKEFLVDHVGRFENIKLEWKYICSKMNAKIELPHINKSIHRDYRSYYDDETMTIVYNSFERDINYFKYSF